MYGLKSVAAVPAYLLRTLLLLVAVCSVLPCAYAQQISPYPRPAAPTDPPKVTLQGTVLNSVTGEPLRRALVSLNGMTSRSAFTDDEGHFAFADITAGPVMLQARKPGYFSTQESGITANTAKSADPVEIKLMPSGVIYGRVMGAEDPLERVPIRLLQSQVVEGRRRWVDVGIKVTDEDGNFRIPDLKPGTYKIAAGPAGSRDLDSLRTGYALTYFQNSPDRATANTLQLLPAQQLELNFKLQRVPLFTISGMIIGGSAQQTNLQMLDSETPYMVPMRSDPSNGSFEAIVPAGKHTLRATSYEGRGQVSLSDQGTQMTATTSISVAKDVSGVVLTLQPTLKIPVVVRRESTKPEAMQVSAQANTRIFSNATAIVRLVSLTEENRMYQAMPDGPGDKASLAFSNLLPGDYEVDVMPQGPWYVASVQCGSKNLLRERLTVTAGGRIDPIEVVMRDDAANLRGTVHGASTYGPLIIVSESEPRRRTHGNYGPDGQIYASGLAPGTYTVYAFDNSDQIEYTNPEALRPYQNKAAHVVLSANQTATITTDIIETEQ